MKNTGKRFKNHLGIYKSRCIPVKKAKKRAENSTIEVRIFCLEATLRFFLKFG